MTFPIARIIKLGHCHHFCEEICKPIKLYKSHSNTNNSQITHRCGFMITQAFKIFFFANKWKVGYFSKWVNNGYHANTILIQLRKYKRQNIQTISYSTELITRVHRFDQSLCGFGNIFRIIWACVCVCVLWFYQNEVSFHAN